MEQNIAKQAMRFGGELPERIANAPELHFGSMFYMQAFFDLDSERLHGSESVGRIPWSSIIAYATHYKLTDDETDDLVYYVGALDRAKVNWLREKQQDG